MATIRVKVSRVAAARMAWRIARYRKEDALAAAWCALRCLVFF